jgi:molybdate transport system ATP-binding protein
MSEIESSTSLRVRIDQQVPIALHGQLHCDAGQMLALIGPSGAGKTSLLRSIAGLLPMRSGCVRVADEVWFDHEKSINVKTLQRHVGFVFQHYALMPHLTAIEDVALSLIDLPRTERLARAQTWLEKVHITGELQQRKPAQLSGGQQQRVALARALARSPKVLLLDEPFSAVDQLSRQGLYELLADLRAELNIPIVLVTHDLFEARLLADQIAVMDAGNIVQQGTPLEIYKSPRNARVADLVGIRNRFHGRWLGPDSSSHLPGVGLLQWLGAPNETQGPILKVRDKGRIEPGQIVTWVIQTDGLILTVPDTMSSSAIKDNTINVNVANMKHLGEFSIVTLTAETPQGVGIRLSLTGPQRAQIERHSNMLLSLDTSWIHIMPLGL